MRVLIVKMSSLGDVIHCMPAVTDLKRHIPEVEIDWVVEEGFSDLVRLHPFVSNVIPIAIRRWRSNWFAHRSEVSEFRRQLKSSHYDVVLDAQGLLKSACVSKMANGPVRGFDRSSARESIAAWFYNRAVTVGKGQHAVARQRALFAKTLDYEVSGSIDYGLKVPQDEEGLPSVFFFHGTTWTTKHWPEACWLELARLCDQEGYRVKLPFGSEVEEQRARRIADHVSSAELIPPGTLSQLAHELSQATAAVAVDTGLGHLATALNIPLVGLYGPTSPILTGFQGPQQISLSDQELACAPCLNKQCQYPLEDGSSTIYPPCFAEMSATRVFQQLQVQLNVVHKT